jgi:hypothetical protein
MRIQIVDDNDNWLKWGNLVQMWIDDGESRPTDVRELRAQLNGKGIKAEVAGADDRLVQIQSYDDSPDGTLVIMVPTSGMRDAKMATVGPGPYANMPLFYDIAFAGAARANLSAQEARDFAVRRIGEYSVNECC